MNVKSIFSGRINMPDIRCLVAWTQEDPCYRDELWSHVYSGERRISVNALWVMTLLPDAYGPWLQSLQDELTDMLLVQISSAFYNCPVARIRKSYGALQPENGKGYLKRVHSFLKGLFFLIIFHQWLNYFCPNVMASVMASMAAIVTRSMISRSEALLLVK